MRLVIFIVIYSKNNLEFRYNNRLLIDGSVDLLRKLS